LAVDEDGGDFGGDDAYEGDLLVDVDALADEVLGEAPHFVAAEVLVCERKLDVVAVVFLWVHLCMYVRSFSIGDSK